MTTLVATANSADSPLGSLENSEDIHGRRREINPHEIKINGNQAFEIQSHAKNTNGNPLEINGNP